MVTRISNSQFLTVLDAIPLENVGWELRFLSERDYSSQIALVSRFAGMGFTTEENDVGGGQVVLDAQDRLFSDPLPAGETRKVQEQEALIQVIDNGVVRFEWLAEDLQEDVLTEDGKLTTVISGRGIGAVLEWAKVLPSGMPTPTTMERVFTAAPMGVWHTLFLEAQANGYLSWVSPMFDGSVDTAGVSWGASQEIKVQAGESLLDLLTRFCEAEDYVWRMAPGFRLLVMKNPGQNRELEIVFTMGRDQAEQQRLVTRREIANVVYASSGEGIAVASDGVSALQWRKRAVWAEAGGTDSSGRSAVANAILNLSKDAKESRTLKIEALRPGRQVFVDFNVSDTVGVEVPADSATSGSRKVVAISLDIDEEGVVTPELTLQSKFESRAIKQQKALNAVGGSSTSDAGSQIPVSAAVSLVKLTDLSDVDTAGVSTGDVLMKSAGGWVDKTPNLDFLTDVDLTVPPTDGQTLTYQSSSGLWKAATGAGGSSHSWETVLDLPGTTFNTTTDWTVVAGAWSSNGTEIVQATTTGVNRAYLKKKMLPGAIIVDVEIMVTAQTGADTQAGVVIGSPGGTTGGATLYRLHMNGATADYFQVEQDGTVARLQVAINWGGLNVWKKLRCVQFANSASIYLDGVLLGSAANAIVTSIGDSTYVGLKTNTASIKVRNLKVWNPKMPALP
jgi:hypothetical protein